MMNKTSSDLLHRFLLSAVIGWITWSSVGPAVVAHTKWALYNYNRWGVAEASVVNRTDDEVPAIERAAAYFQEDWRIGIPIGDTKAEIDEWKNFGGQVGWFLPPRSRVIPMLNPEAEIADAVVTTHSIDWEDPPPNWEVVYNESLAQIWISGGRNALPDHLQNNPRDRFQQPPGDREAALKEGFSHLGTRLASIFALIAFWWSVGYFSLPSATLQISKFESLGVALPMGTLLAVVSAIPASYLLPNRIAFLTTGVLIAVALGFGVRRLCGQIDRSRASNLSWSPMGSKLKSNAIFGLLLIAWFSYTVWGFLCADAGCVPGLAHYGIKARAIFQEGGFPTDYPGGDGWELHHPDYPVGSFLPILWAFVTLGSPDLHLTRIINPLFLLISALILWNWMLRHQVSRWIAMPVALAPLLSHGGLFPCRNFYQEPLMMALFTAGLFLLAHSSSRNRQSNIWCGSALLASSTLIKNEGIALVVATMIAFSFIRNKRSFIVPIFLCTLAYTVPWKIILHLTKTESFNYDWTRPLKTPIAQTINTTQESFQFLANILIHDGWRYCYWWWFLGIAIGVSFWKKRLPVPFIPVLLFLYIAAVVFSMTASMIPLEWHAVAFYRVLASCGPIGLVAATIILFGKKTLQPD